MKNVILITVLGNSQYYKSTNYSFNTENEVPYKIEHWYSTFALLSHLKENLSIIPTKVIILIPDTPEGAQSFESGWEIRNESEKKGKARESVKDILMQIIPPESDFIGVKVPEIKEEQEIWGFLNILMKELNQIENSSVIIDITHGFRLFQSLLFSFVYYFENISSNTLEKIYYAIFQGPQKESPFIELDQLIMLQHEISQIKLLIKNLDISAFEDLKQKVRALRKIMEYLQKIMLFVNNGVVSDKLLEKINHFLGTNHFEKIPQIVFKEYDEFYRNSFYQGIIPEMQLIKEKIFGKNEEVSKIWKRQLNLADLLLTRKMDIATSLQLIRESFISWLCEEILDIHPLDFDERAISGKIYGILKKGQRINKYGINKSEIFRTVSELADNRNDFAHVFTTTKQINILQSHSEKLITYQNIIKERIKELLKLFLLEENKKSFKEIVKNIDKENDAE